MEGGNLLRRAGALGGVHPEPSATGLGCLRAGVVDADVACELGQPVTSRGRIR